MSRLHAPHRQIQVNDEKERFLIELLDTLWTRYRERVSYVRTYEEILERHGAAFVNDHIAFRTLAAQIPAAGLFAISRPFEALGYVAAACYEFPGDHLQSIHYQHANPQFPKLFITQLKTWELSPAARHVLLRALKARRPALGDDVLGALSRIGAVAPRQRKRLLGRLVRFFEDLPWPAPQRKDLLRVNEESQFGAWVLVNGYDVNHFTASIDLQRAAALDDIEKTVAALKDAGVPMKAEIEGARGSRLRQTSTEAVMREVRVRDGARSRRLPWTYAYFELAERPLLRNPVTGETQRFDGFLRGQATNLFQMTRLRS